LTKQLQNWTNSYDVLERCTSTAPAPAAFHYFFLYLFYEKKMKNESLPNSGTFMNFYHQAKSPNKTGTLNLLELPQTSPSSPTPPPPPKL
jgi:hypothetical protein